MFSRKWWGGGGGSATTDEVTTLRGRSRTAKDVDLKRRSASADSAGNRRRGVGSSVASGSSGGPSDRHAVVGGGVIGSGAALAGGGKYGVPEADVIGSPSNRNYHEEQHAHHVNIVHNLSPMPIPYGDHARVDEFGVAENRRAGVLPGTALEGIARIPTIGVVDRQLVVNAQQQQQQQPVGLPDIDTHQGTSPEDAFPTTFVQQQGMPSNNTLGPSANHGNASYNTGNNSMMTSNSSFNAALLPTSFSSSTTCTMPEVLVQETETQYRIVLSCFKVEVSGWSVKHVNKKDFHPEYRLKVMFDLPRARSLLWEHYYRCLILKSPSASPEIAIARPRREHRLLNHHREHRQDPFLQDVLKQEILESSKSRLLDNNHGPRISNAELEDDTTTTTASGNYHASGPAHTTSFASMNNFALQETMRDILNQQNNPSSAASYAAAEASAQAQHHPQSSQFLSSSYNNHHMSIQHLQGGNSFTDFASLDVDLDLGLIEVLERETSPRHANAPIFSAKPCARSNSTTPRSNQGSGSYKIKVCPSGGEAMEVSSNGAESTRTSYSGTELDPTTAHLPGSTLHCQFPTRSSSNASMTSNYMKHHNYNGGSNGGGGGVNNSIGAAALSPGETSISLNSYAGLRSHSSSPTNATSPALLQGVALGVPPTSGPHSNKAGIEPTPIHLLRALRISEQDFTAQRQILRSDADFAVFFSDLGVCDMPERKRTLKTLDPMWMDRWCTTLQDATMGGLITRSDSGCSAGNGTGSGNSSVMGGGTSGSVGGNYNQSQQLQSSHLLLGGGGGTISSENNASSNDLLQQQQSTPNTSNYLFGYLTATASSRSPNTYGGSSGGSGGGYCNDQNTPQYPKLDKHALAARQQELASGIAPCMTTSPPATMDRCLAFLGVKRRRRSSSPGV
ncbi:unnamed protein product [Amoebophrya sp. A25]|nr:unnamed protein product [Amoebophrya sp. A25]|eukprot:GSA25T00007500001.1